MNIVSYNKCISSAARSSNMSSSKLRGGAVTCCHMMTRDVLVIAVLLRMGRVLYLYRLICKFTSCTQSGQNNGRNTRLVID